MSPITTILSRYGFRISTNPECDIDFCAESPANISFFLEIMKRLGIGAQLRETARVNVATRNVEEQEFVEAYTSLVKSSGGCSSPDELQWFEPHIAALVRIVNELGLTTNGSCQGHDMGTRRRPAYLWFSHFDDEHAELDRLNTRLARCLFETMADGLRTRIRNTHIDFLSPLDDSTVTPEGLRDTWERLHALADAITRKRDECFAFVRAGQRLVVQCRSEARD